MYDHLIFNTPVMDIFSSWKGIKKGGKFYLLFLLN